MKRRSEKFEFRKNDIGRRFHVRRSYDALSEELPPLSLMNCPAKNQNRNLRMWIAVLDIIGSFLFFSPGFFQVIVQGEF